MTPTPAPTISPTDADALEMYGWYPFWWEEFVTPNYDDVIGFDKADNGAHNATIRH